MQTWRDYALLPPEEQERIVKEINKKALYGGLEPKLAGRYSELVTRMEFSTKNMMVDESVVNNMFVKLTAENGSTSTCVIHLIEDNMASLACTGFSAPPAQP